MEKQILFLKLRQHLDQKRVAIRHSSLKEDAGYTLIELLIVIILIGILAAVAAPGWLSFVSQRRVNATNEFVLRALQEAQNQAKSKKVRYSVSFRTKDGVPEVAVYPTKQSGSTTDQTTDYDPEKWNNWKSLRTELGIQKGQVIVGTNLDGENKKKSSIDYTLNSTNKITFDDIGALSLNPTANANDVRELTIVVATDKNGNAIDSTKRCVKVVTLLGALQTGRGKYDATNNPQGCP